MRLALLAGAAGLVLWVGAAAASQPTTTYLDKQAGFQITLPKTWHYVPSSVATVQATVKKLDREKQTGLASAYALLIRNAAARASLTSFVFQAFLYPALGSVPTGVSLGVVRTSKAYGAADLPSLGETFAKAFAMTKGAKIDKPAVISLPAGHAALLEGTDPVPGGLSAGFAFYLIPHGKLLYELGFRTEASLLPKATVFAAIAHGFVFA